VTTFADEVFIAGSTAGCFGAGCSPGSSATFLGLTYSNSTFAGTTANGFRGIGGNPNPGANFNNLGSFTLSTAPNTYSSQTFTLRVTFTAPQGITGSNQVAFTSTITGTVISNNVGGVQIDFVNTPILFTFNDPNCEPDPTGGIPGQQTTCGTGSFFFSVNDLAIDPGQTVSLTGQITGAQQSTATAANVGVSGRVMTAQGRGIKNVQITLIDSNGNQRTATTTSFGYYHFDDVTAGETVTLSAKARRFKFAQSSIVRTMNESISDADFVTID
jgi:hypothetical protein